MNINAIKERYELFETDEIIGLVKRGTLTDEAHGVAVEILKNRSVDVSNLPTAPAIVSVAPSPSLVRGELGLAKTFWLFFIVPNIIFSIVIALTTAPLPSAILSILVVLYFTPILMGLWRAAGKYKGSSASFILILINLICLLSAVSLIGHLMRAYKLTQGL